MNLVWRIVSYPSRSLLRILRRKKIKFAKKIKASAENPILHGNSAKHFFNLSKTYAAMIGVNPIFIKRANIILEETRSLANSLRFLDIYISLKRKKPISRFQFHQYLKTNDEVEITKNLISQQLNEENIGSRQYSLQFQMFRLQNKDASDPEVIAYVKQSMQTVIDERLQNFQGREKHFTKKAALSTLVEMKRVFDKNDKRFFLDRGTLLGAVREKNFVASDYDIDVGVFSDEITLKEIIEMFKGTNFALNQETDYKVAFTSPSGIQVDFFLSIRENGYVKSKGVNDVHTWYFVDFDLIEYDFLGHDFYIPDNYEKHLEENYGNWKTPALFYDPSYDEANLVHGDNFETLMYLTTRFCRAVRKNMRFHAHEPAIIMRDNFNIDFTDYFPKKTGKTVTPKKNNEAILNSTIILTDMNELNPLELKMIEHARELGQRIVVGLFSDNMFQNSPPHNSHDETIRLRIAHAINMVDEVYLENSLHMEDFSQLQKRNPKTIIIADKWIKYFPTLEENISSDENNEEKIVANGLKNSCKLIRFNRSD